VQQQAIRHGPVRYLWHGKRAKLLLTVSQSNNINSHLEFGQLPPHHATSSSAVSRSAAWIPLRRCHSASLLLGSCCSVCPAPIVIITVTRSISVIIIRRMFTYFYLICLHNINIRCHFILVSTVISAPMSAAANLAVTNCWLLAVCINHQLLAHL